MHGEETDQRFHTMSHKQQRNMQDSGTDESATSQSMYRKYGYVCHPFGKYGNTLTTEKVY
jgi:hypothetical protein